MRSLFLRVPLAFLFVFAFYFQAASAAVLAIDYGSDWIKASLMKPGVPFDILLNKDSKRKIQSSVGWKKSDRLFGTDAYNIVRNFVMAVGLGYADSALGWPFPFGFIFFIEIFSGGALQFRCHDLFH
jgi:hypothetical protein